MTFSTDVLAWFDIHGRKTLPWQQNINAYRVWVSEIMLQQTQVSTVIPYYQRFMQCFPEITVLANAQLDEVLQHWAGLGYYSRAKNLHKTAQIIVQQYQAEFPRTVTELSQLPGIGRSTAGAIAAIAFQQHAAILDGNVKRVLARYYGVSGWTGGAAVEKQLWQLAEKNTPQQRVEHYAQAMMDLGAMLCTRSKPQCDHCPLQAQCVAFISHRTHELPSKKPKKLLPIKHCTFLVISHQQTLLLQQRPLVGIWPGLWSFLELAENQSVEQFCHLHFPNIAFKNEDLMQFRHTFSHFHLEINAIYVELNEKPLQVMADDTQQWYKMRQEDLPALPAPVQRIINHIARKL